MSNDKLFGNQKKIDVNKDGKISGADFKILQQKGAMTSEERDEDTTCVPKELSAKEQAKTKKKYGGKITFRMTGGQVVDSSYD
jgi:hypothetical protein